LRNRHRRDDGARWSGSALERATGGKVNASWVSKLATGKYEEPGFSKIVAMSHAMGIPLEAWLEEEERGRDE
jgi:transcriptional regulator with XRE-family HTH domain